MVETGDAVLATIAKTTSLLPPSVRTIKFQDRMQTIRAAVAEVKETLIITAVLVVRWSSSCSCAPASGRPSSQRSQSPCR